MKILLNFTLRMKTKGKYFVIPLVIYPFDIVVSVDQDDNTLKEILKNHIDEVGDFFDKPLKAARTATFNNGLTVIRFKNYEATTLSTIAHESFHATTFILDFIDMPFCIDKNDEAYAYLHGYIVGKITSNLNRK